MAEIKNELIFKNTELIALFNKFQKNLADYVNKDKDLVAKGKRKLEVIAASDRFTARLRRVLTTCPKGTTWDRASGTCKKG